jgi:long-chain acyl-CoA synthetase
MTILDYAAGHPDQLALDDLTRRRTFAEMVDRSVRAGRLMGDGFGIGPGGHVAMLFGNRVEFCEVALGALLAGVWFTPVNWHLTAEEVAYILDDSGAGLLVADPQFAATAHDAAKLAARPVPVVVAGDELDAALALSSDEPFDLDAEAGGSMLYTSGTTGRPKGVRRPRASTVQAQLITTAAPGKLLRHDGGGPHLVTGPLYHAGPLGFASIDLHNGAPLIMMPKWDPAEALTLIQERGVRNSHFVPTMFVRCLRLPDDVRAAFDPSSLRTILHGAAPVSVSVKTRMIEWWGPVLLEYWGSTEGGVFTLVDSETWLTKPGTVGKAIATYEVFAVDADNERLGPGEIGTLYTRNLLTTDVFEYHEAPEKTAGAHLEPGVFTMGDVGYVDEDGFVFLSDRAANMIISGGVNIYPAEIEQVLIEHPAVADVAVFGIPDDEWGESVKAAVELIDGYAPSPELEREILAFGRERLAGFKVPRSIDFEAELPRHPTGKLYTRLLRDKYWNREGRFI